MKLNKRVYFNFSWAYLEDVSSDTFYQVKDPLYTNLREIRENIPEQILDQIEINIK
jgi:hypothetical protein